MDAATLLAQREQALAVVMQRLTALDQERQQLLQGALRLEGAIEALRAVVEASRPPDVPAVAPDGERGVVANVG